MIRRLPPALSLALALFAWPVLAQEAPAPMTAHDLVTMPRLGSPTATADGKWAVYTVTRTDPETLERDTETWLTALDRSEAMPVKLDLQGDAGDPAFASDGRLYFLSDRRPLDADEADEPSSQVWRAALDGNGDVTAPVQVSALPGGIAGFKLSPDGRKIAVWADMPRGCGSFGCAQEATPETRGNGRLYDASEGFIRHWDSWEVPGENSRVFVFDLVEGKVSGAGVALDGPAGDMALNADTPTRPSGGGEEIAWAADSSGVYFTARITDADEPRSTNTDIYWSDLSGRAPLNLTANNRATDTLPAPSPDGKYLAWAAMARPGYEADRLAIHLRDLASGETRILTDGWDRSVGSITWTPDSRWIVATAHDVLDTPAFRIDPKSGKVEKLDLLAGNEASIGNLVPLPGRRLLFTRDAIAHPPELFIAREGRKARQLSQAASSEVAGLAPVATQRFSFAGADGDTVWGQITKLADHEGPMPVILYVHGGPQGSFDDGWSSRWNPRVVASQGYAVVSVDFHGSTGYGQAFTDSINRDWGGKPLQDLRKGLAAARALDPQIDGSRACAMGASYGGYMMNWIAGQWPDRFDCLIQHDGLFDLRGFYYETEELWFPRWDFGGSYTEVPEEYERWNPVNHVANWRTPMLVITGERDFRIPYSQGIASFTALQEQGIPAKLLVFPEENHWVLGAENSLQWHETVFDWLARWLRD